LWMYCLWAIHRWEILSSGLNLQCHDVSYDLWSLHRYRHSLRDGADGQGARLTDQSFDIVVHE
jgi:hypothetical protein